MKNKKYIRQELTGTKNITAGKECIGTDMSNRIQVLQGN